MTTPTKWFYADTRNEAVGPFSFDNLLKLHAAGVIDENTAICVEGGSKWESLVTTSEYQTSRPVAPPPIKAASLTDTTNTKPQHTQIEARVGAVIAVLSVIFLGYLRSGTPLFIASSSRVTTAVEQAKTDATSNSKSMTKEEFKEKLFKLAPLARYGAMQIPTNQFIAAFGKPSNTQSIDGEKTWYYECTDGFIQIVLTGDPAVIGQVVGTINEY